MQLLTFLKTPAPNPEQRILKLFLLVILPLMAILTGVSFFYIDRVRDRIAEETIRSQGENIKNRMIMFLDPVQRDLRYLQFLAGMDSGFNPKNPADICEFFNQYSRFHLGHVKRVIFFDKSVVTVYTFEQGSCKGPEELADAALAGFLKETLNQSDWNKINWDALRFDPDKNESSVLAAIVLENSDPADKYVLALELDSTDFTIGFEEFTTACVFLFSDSKNEIPQQFFFTGNRVTDVNETADPLILTVAGNWKTRQPPSEKTYRLTFNSKPWWVSILPLNKTGRLFYSGLIVSESDILNTRLNLKNVLLASFIIILITAVILWKRYQYDLEQIRRAPVLNDMSDEELLQVIASLESDRLEFKSTLRWNLKTNKPDKAMEIACLKTIAAFLNSEGGTLLVGIEDDGHLIGIQADQFPNDDKFLLHFNNLINQHLGSDTTENFSFNIRHLNESDILVVDCRRSAVPVFLKNQNNEDFYVRMGPGTRQLTTAEALAYVRDHF